MLAADHRGRVGRLKGYQGSLALVEGKFHFTTDVVFKHYGHMPVTLFIWSCPGSAHKTGFIVDREKGKLAMAWEKAPQFGRLAPGGYITAPLYGGSLVAFRAGSPEINYENWAGQSCRRNKA